MKNLYIRVKTGFYTHRKTARLRAIIGDDAFWVVPRLWAYAAENQPDGNLSEYTSSEIAMLIGCDKHATSILDALKSSGYVDSDGLIHDWQEHNGYHKAFSERGKAAASARWAKENPPKPPKEKKLTDNDIDIETSNASSMLVAFEKFWSAYPKRVSKGAAEKAFAKAMKETTLETILAALEKLKPSYGWQKDGGQFIPYPATWLNAKGWNDEPQTEPQQQQLASQAESVFAIKTKLEEVRKSKQRAKDKAAPDPLGGLQFSNEADKAEFKRLAALEKELAQKLTKA